jgi:hypothetical protein
LVHLETNIVKANIRALLTTTQQQPSSTTAQVIDEKQRTLCELLERWATVGKISMSQAALIQHQCGYISQTTQQQAAAAAALAAGATNHHLTNAHHNLNSQQNGTSNNKLPAHHHHHPAQPPQPPPAQQAPQPQAQATLAQQQAQVHHAHTGHGNHHQNNSHHHDRSSQDLNSSLNAVKKRRSGKNKIVTLLMKNAEGEYECVRTQVDLVSLFFRASVLVRLLAQCSMSEVFEMSRNNCARQGVCRRLAERKRAISQS